MSRVVPFDSTERSLQVRTALNGAFKSASILPRTRSQSKPFMPVASDTLVMDDAHEEAAHVNSEANLTTPLRSSFPKMLHRLHGNGNVESHGGLKVTIRQTE